MFNFLTAKERSILLIGPILLALVIIFLGWEANHWRAEMLKEEQLKLKWQTSYIALHDNVQQFAEQQKQLIHAINELKTNQTQQTQDLKHALHTHKDWANSPLPDDVKRVLNGTPSH